MYSIDSTSYPPDNLWQHVKNDEQASKHIRDEGPRHRSPARFCWGSSQCNAVTPKAGTPNEFTEKATALFKGQASQWKSCQTERARKISIAAIKVISSATRHLSRDRLTSVRIAMSRAIKRSRR